jgi:hypothetical protein
MPSLKTKDGLPLLSREAQKKLRWIEEQQDQQGYVALRGSSRVSGELISADVVERVLGSANRYYLTALGIRLLDALKD